MTFEGVSSCLVLSCLSPGITTHALQRRRGAATVPVAHAASTAPLIARRRASDTLEAPRRP